MASGFQWTELFVKNSKVIVGAYILLAGAGFAGGYFTGNKPVEPQVMVPEKTPSVVTEPLCDENTVARICGKVVRQHASGRLH